MLALAHCRNSPRKTLGRPPMDGAALAQARAAPLNRRFPSTSTKELAHGRRRPPDPHSFHRRRRRHQASPRPRARPRRAHHRARQQRLLRRCRVPPRDPRLHGPGRRSDRTGTSGSDLPDLKAEFSSAPHVRGAVSMARAQNPDSANSQFFIVQRRRAASSTANIPSGARSRAGWNMSTRCRSASRRASPAGSSRRRFRKSVKKVALITGASAGLGVEFARQLSKRGHRWCSRRGARIGWRRSPKSSAMPARSRSTCRKRTRAAKLIADIEAARRNRSTCWSTMRASD